MWLYKGLTPVYPTFVALQAGLNKHLKLHAMLFDPGLAEKHSTLTCSGVFDHHCDQCKLLEKLFCMYINKEISLSEKKINIPS